MNTTINTREILLLDLIETYRAR